MAAIQEKEKIVKLIPGRSPADAALLDIGILYLHPDNPQQSYTKALRAFERLMENYPRSQCRIQAQAMISVLNDLLKTRKQTQGVIAALKNKAARRRTQLSNCRSELHSCEQTVQQRQKVIDILRDKLDKLKNIDLDLNSQ